MGKTVEKVEQKAEECVVNMSKYFLVHCVEELDLVYKSVVWFQKFFSVASATLAMITLLSNAAIMIANSVNFHPHALSYLAALNAFMKGLELKFQFDQHNQQCIKGLAMIRNLDLKGHSLIKRLEADMDDKKERKKLHKEAKEFARAFEHCIDCVGSYCKPRGQHAEASGNKTAAESGDTQEVKTV